NSSDVTICVIDGEAIGSISKAAFPAAKLDQLVQTSSSAQVLLEVATHKADLALMDSTTAAAYMAANPGQIKQVSTAGPLAASGNTIAIPQGEDRLRRMLDITTQALLANGTIERIIQKYEKYPGTLARVAKPYEIMSH